MNKMGVTCETCDYFNTLLTSFGFCRRHPPKVFVSEDAIITHYPEVTKDDWCGEHSQLGKNASTVVNR